MSDALDAEYGPAVEIRIPIAYSEELALEIVDRIASGEHVSGICESPGMPCTRTVWRWLGRHPEFERQYNYATQVRGEKFADELIALADAPCATREQIEQLRLRLDARKWVAARLLPRYSDRQLVAVTSPNRLAEEIDPVEAARRIFFAIGLADQANGKEYTADYTQYEHERQASAPVMRNDVPEPQPRPAPAAPAAVVEDVEIISETIAEPADYLRGLSEQRQAGEQMARRSRRPGVVERAVGFLSRSR